MRATLTLDEDVSERLEREVARSGKDLEATVNDALRAGLGIATKPRMPSRFRVEAHAFGFPQGLDLDRMNQVSDELEAEDVVRKLAR